MREVTAEFRPQRSVYSVSDLLADVRGLLDDRVGRVWVAGEISNLRRPGSGHSYFTLKDDSAQLRAALFRGAARRVPFEPEDGLEVLVYGEVTVYEPRGDLQIIVQHLEPRGRGALQLAFEQLRARLEAEGLFAPERKRPLPEAPRRVGMVTSLSGAALRDVFHVSARRAPATPLLIAGTRVQGEGSELEIAAALERMGQQEDVDVILLVRGGGSLEDLQSFNSDAVARAIVACPIPVVSGVGHETDLCIADLVADERAATPSAAAALVLPDRRALSAQLAHQHARLVTALRGRLARARARLAREGDALRALAPRTRLAAQRARWRVGHRGLLRGMQALLETRGQRWQAQHAGLARNAQAATGRGEAKLANLAGRLDALSPLAVLSRGYAIVHRQQDDAIVRRAADVSEGDALRILLGRGELRASVTGRRDSDSD